MKRRDDIVQIWVSKSFRKQIKQEAFKEDMQIIDYTKKIAEERGLKKIDEKKKVNIWKL
jgi:hypothetical protein